MKLIPWLVEKVINIGVRVICRIDAPDVDKVQARGPLIVLMNHTGQLEVPVTAVLMLPRPISACAKAELWENPLFAWLLDMMGADRKSTRLNSSHIQKSRMPSSA